MAVAAAAVVGVAVLAGCSDGEQANETLPSTSLSGSAEPSETLQPLGPPDLPMPAEAREMTAAGAEAFLRYYMDVYSWTQAHMETSYMAQLSQGCDTCDRLIGYISDDAAKGYEYDGGRATVLDVSMGELGGTDVEAAFGMSQEALIVRAPTGEELVDLGGPPDEVNCGAVLRWSAATSSWSMAQWDVN